MERLDGPERMAAKADRTRVTSWTMPMRLGVSISTVTRQSFWLTKDLIWAATFALAQSPKRICISAPSCSDPAIDELCRWKLGQLGPGSEIGFRRVSWDTALQLRHRNEAWLDGVGAAISSSDARSIDLFREEPEGGAGGPKLLVVKAEVGSRKPTVTFRTVSKQG